MGTLAALVRTWSRPENAGISWNFVPGVPNLPDGLLGWTLSSDNASVRAFWRHDTLLVRASGVRSLTAAFPSVPAGKKITCRILSGDKNPRKRNIVPAKVRWPQDLLFKVNRCFPADSLPISVFTVKF
jgi:hypothetical protein